MNRFHSLYFEHLDYNFGVRGFDRHNVGKSSAGLVEKVHYLGFFFENQNAID